MSDQFSPVSLQKLLSITLSGISRNRFMGIPGTLFFRPSAGDPFRMERYGTILSTPIGVAAGPHTQMAQNITAAWLCGARYIELKTIQTLDELDVLKPCIDMQDVGYNCEWSQELKIRQSFNGYLNAWILIHILHHEMKMEGQPGTLFNMSAGYNLDGIQKENVQWFFRKMKDCSQELASARDTIRPLYPAIDAIQIPSCISDSITLSTMHGCPPDEIGKIGSYLINDLKLHTTIKLNPTLLGADELRTMLNRKLGFSTVVPDLAFEHDLKYPDALRLIDSLSMAASANGVHFSVKLTNTLECLNNRQVFRQEEKMMYMSGRALHPISINLARKLQHDRNGLLDISFSAGADCFNVAEVLACGLKPVTVCSDLLKPGGYGRLFQYIENIRTGFAQKAAGSIDEFIIHSTDKPGQSVPGAALTNLNRYANLVADLPAYHKTGITEPDIKTARPLGYFDCIHAPCRDACPAGQDIPSYLFHTASGNLHTAYETIFDTNPFPSVTGMICDHLCQLKCTRINYDEPLRIREVKRFVAENHGHSISAQHAKQTGLKAAIIGGGPAGLSCGWFLLKAGMEVHLFEKKRVPGGMVSAAIPSFRLTDEAIEKDINRMLAAGLILHTNESISHSHFEKLKVDYDAVFLAAGAQRSVTLKIDGIDAAGVIDPLEFLFAVKTGNMRFPGSQVLVIGGGNTAMDAARTAFRMVGKEGKVTIVYRRSIREMPADKGEIQAVLDEGIGIIELANPERIITHNGHVASLVCSRTILTTVGKNGRPVPVSVPGSAFELTCDTIIPAIGQQPDLDFIDPAKLKTKPGSYKTGIDRLYIGGDAMRGASTAINAIADGRKAAAEILNDLGLYPAKEEPDRNRRFHGKSQKGISLDELMHRKSIRQFGVSPSETAFSDRRNFNLVMDTFSAESAKEEASRCLYCDEICHICVTVCPNLANFGYEIDPVHHVLQKAVLQDDGSIGLVADTEFIVQQCHQVLNIRDLCNECGNCTTFCPSGGRPFADKPGLSLSVESFNLEQDGYFLSHLPDRDILIYRKKSRIKTLSLQDGRYYFETEQVKAIIDPAGFRLLEVKFMTPCIKEYHFTFAAEMSIILKGAIQLTIQNH